MGRLVAGNNNIKPLVSGFENSTMYKKPSRLKIQTGFTLKQSSLADFTGQHYNRNISVR